MFYQDYGSNYTNTIKKNSLLWLEYYMEYAI